MSALESPLPNLIHLLKTYTSTPEEGFRVLQVYQTLVDHIRLLPSRPQFVTRHDDRRISQKWNDLRDWLYTLRSKTNATKTFPSYHDALVELFDNAPQNDVTIKYTIAEDYSIQIGRLTGVSLTTLKEAGGFEELLSHIHGLQPRCEIRVVGTEEQDALRRDPGTHLVTALRKQIDTADRDLIIHTLAMLTEITVRAAAYVHFHGFAITTPQFEHFCGAAKIWVRSTVSQPFSHIDLALRSKLARLDVCTLACAILYRAIDIANHIRVRQELAWRLHHWTVQCIVNAFKVDALAQGLEAETAVAVADVMCNPFRWESFHSANPTPLANFLPHGWARYGRHRYCRTLLRIVSSLRMQPALRHLEDVRREPVDPPRSPYACATPVYICSPGIDSVADCAICGEVLVIPAKQGPQMTMRAHCDAGHLYHHKCLDSLINGIEAYSN